MRGGIVTISSDLRGRTLAILGLPTNRLPLLRQMFARITAAVDAIRPESSFRSRSNEAWPSGVMANSNPAAARPFCCDDEFIDPERLRVGEEAGAEVGHHEELVELHLREIGGAQDDVGVVDDEFSVEPAADDAVAVGPVAFEVQACSA